MSSKDPKTGLPYGEHGTAQDAVEYVLDNSTDFGMGEAHQFLTGWREGSLDEWPEYYVWLKHKYGIV